MRADNRNGPPGGTESESWAGRPDELEDTSPTLFTDEPERPWTHDLHQLEDRRRAGEKAALQAASRWWREAAEEALDELAASGRPFTAEDLRAEVGDVPGPSQNAMGAVFAQASRDGLIECVDTTCATRRVANQHALRVWRGTRHG